MRVAVDPAKPGEILNLEEVTLFDSAGVQLPRESLQFVMSSEWDAKNGAANCNDGLCCNPAQLNAPADWHCHSKPLSLDPKPYLNISYPCDVSLGSVSVYNRRDQYMVLLTSFVLQHLVQGRLVQQEPFAVSRREYTFNIRGGGAQQGGRSSFGTGRPRLCRAAAVLRGLRMPWLCDCL